MCLVGRLHRIAVCGIVGLASIGSVKPAFSQTDLNRYVPRVARASAETDDSFNDEAPEYPDARRAPSRQPTRTAQLDETPSYRRTAAQYQNPRYRPEGTGAGRPPMSGQRSYPIRTADRRGSDYESSPQRSAMSTQDDQADRPSSPPGRGMYEDSPLSRLPAAENRSSRTEDYAAVAYNDRPTSAGYGNRRSTGVPARNSTSYGNSTNRSGFGIFGPMASRMPAGSSQGGRAFGNMFASKDSATSSVLPEPVVTPDAVYLDAESISVGRPARSMPVVDGAATPVFDGPMTEGGSYDSDPRSFLPGGPIRGRTFDGYSNPHCNDCSGHGDCGGNCGPRCGNNCGMYGGCEDGYDCCGGCGPNYAPWNGPYGRPWIFAPLDWLFGGMWHSGPYWGACDPCGNWWWGQDLTVFGGVHDFRSPVNITGNSNFGFHEGVNWSMPLWHEFGIGAQVGFQATQSNFGSGDLDIYDDYRNQVFLTTGLFHRPCDGQGWQYGVVFDYLNDEFYQQFNVGQLRGELSWLWDCQNEVGFWFAAGVMDSDNSDDTIFLGATEYSPINQYAFFYRRRFARGGEGRAWGGFTGNSGGLVGADFRLPISRGWAVETGFNYIIDQKNENPIFQDETWNVGMNLVWHWGGNANCRSLYRPLLGVADNGSFMVTRRGLIN